MSSAKSGGKPLSPEKRYNASKKRDEEIRIMKVANKQSDQYLSVATWETNLGVKDVTGFSIVNDMSVPYTLSIHSFNIS